MNVHLKSYCAGALLLSALVAAAGTTPSRPNILFLFADDQCLDTINALGNREVQTPNLDRQRSVSLDGYKLILYPKIKQARRYNLRKDPLELRDLADKPSSLPQMKKLFARFRQLQTELDDQLELASVYPHLANP